jgi:hypothetical protein
MMAQRSAAFAIALCLWASQAVAAGPLFVHRGQLTATDLAATAINSAAWTGWMQVDKAGTVALEIAYTYSAGTAVTMRCESSDSSGTAADAGFDVHVLEQSATSGTSTSVVHTWSNAISSADEKWTWNVTSIPHNFLNCALTATSGDGSDVATVKYKARSP